LTERNKWQILKRWVIKIWLWYKRNEDN